MIHPLLKNLFTISLMCSGVAILLLIIRKVIGKNTGAWWRSFLWVLIFLRLCIPIMIDSPIGVINNISNNSVVEQIQNTDNNRIDTVDVSIVTAELTSNKQDASVAKTPNLNTEMLNPNSFSPISLINPAYLLGLFISIAILTTRILLLLIKASKLEICNNREVLRLFRNIKKQLGIKRRIKVIIGEKDSIPALYGLFIPHVIIPKSIFHSTNVTELEYVFIHELTHYKRRDITKLWLLELCTCIHWFNPILHLIKPIIVQDIELACDEMVLSKINNTEYINYSNVLVNFSTKKRSKHPLVVTSNFAGKRGNKLKERLVMIKKYNRKRIISVGIILALVISGVLVACTTNAKRDNEIENYSDSVKVKYSDYYYTDMPEQFLEPFIEQFKKLELNNIDMDTISEDMYGDFRYRIIADSKFYRLYRDKDNIDKFYLVNEKGKDEPWDYSIFISNEFSSLLMDIEKAVLEYGELIKYDKDSYEEVYSIISGEITLDVIKTSEHWNFYKDNNYYLCRAIFPDENEYHVTISSNKTFSKRYIDYKYDSIEIYNADKDESIGNPSIEEFIEFATILFNDEVDMQPIEDNNIYMLSKNKIVNINIFDVSDSSGLLLYTAENEKEIFDTVVDSFNSSNAYTDDFGTTHPIRVELTMENGEKIYLLYGTQGYITVIDGNEQYNIRNIELEGYFNMLIGNNVEKGYDINAGNGHIIETLMEIIDGKRPIGDFTEERSLEFVDNTYSITMFTLTDEYDIELKGEVLKADVMLNYLQAELIIKNNTDNWTLNNPTSEEIQELMMDEYYAQREDWKEDNVESRYSGNFIEIISPDGVMKIDLTDEAADNIKFHMMATSATTIINNYKGTDEEFHMKGIEIFLNDMNYEYPVPLWKNDFGSKAIGFANDPIPLSEAAYDIIVAIAKEQAGYVEGNINDIYNLVSVELVVNDKSQGKVIDESSVKAIEELLLSSKKINGIGGCPFGAELRMTRADGEVITAILPTDSCGYFVLGTGACYAYDRRDSNDVRKYEQEDLLKHFGMQSFSDVKTIWNISDLDITYAMDVVRDYYKAIEDKDISLLNNCLNSDRYDISETFFDEFSDTKLTLDNIYDYSSEHQSNFNYHLDNGDAMLIVLQVDFTVEYLINSPNTPYNDGQYEQWNFILVRERLGSPWKIYDQGY